MVNLDWNAVQCFLLVAQHGSLSAASKVLGVSVATLGRRIVLLEDQVGAPLLRRGPSGATVTEAGQIMLTHAESGARHFAQLSRMARTLRDGPSEIPVRISSTESLISDVLAPRVKALIEQQPNLKLELDVSNSISDLNAGEADIAIRMVRPLADSLVARKLPVIRMGLYCSQAYLANRQPKELKLANERLLWLDAGYGDIAENKWLAEQELEPATVLRAVSVRSLQQAAIAGVGIAPLPAFSAAGLVEIPNTGLPARHPWLVFHRDTRNIARMKQVRQWIVNSCAAAFGNK